MPDNSNLFPIAIFAGRGQLPKILIDDCLTKNRRFKLFLLHGENYEIDYSKFNPITLGYGEIEKFLKILNHENLNHIVFIGAVNKPNFASLKVDKKGAILLGKIIANKILGDDAVLKTVINFFEKEGLKIVRIDELLDCIISTKTTLTKVSPNTQNLIDIEIGAKAIKHFSKFDVGQSIIVSQKQIIAVEALEGTDEMIDRCAKLKNEFAKNAILIKMKKIYQTNKADLPTIGVETIEKCAKAKIIGIAIEANSTLVIDKENVIKKADEFGLFLITIK
ncbi:MAG: DUF1009 domain-containing protein [Proteobacteria bacterium]|nr:DUF1009 domain-containing protein [Pseudomonadota bacterium]NCA28868.1 DUF1009 domain-containing protein [Pseudomonadota bacterium]